MKTTKSHAVSYISSLIEVSLDPLIVINTQGKVIDLNKANIDIIGVGKKKIQGTDVTTYFTEPDHAQIVCDEVFSNGFVTDLHLTYKHTNGDQCPVVVNGTVYTGIDGNIEGAILIARNEAEQPWATELRIVNKELVIQNKEKEKRANELFIANKKLTIQNTEKAKKAKELGIANKELTIQNTEKVKIAIELDIANIEIANKDKEKEKRAAELEIANIELAFQNQEKEKREAELRIANYARILIEASRNPLFTINIEGKITDLNNASVTILGMTRETLIGTSFFTYFTEPQKANKIYKEVYAKGFVVDYPLTIRNEKLTEVLFNGSVFKDDAGNVLGVVVVASDITEQKRIESELIEAKVFAEMATSIAEDAKLNAENAVKAKQQFLSNMSHEIRTPMNAIIGFTKVLLKSEMSAKQFEYLTAIKMSGDALIVLINDILDLAKVEAGKMIFESVPFQMKYSISAMLHLFEAKIQEKNLKLITEYDRRIPEVLLGDSTRLHQIILNLVSNAVKFTMHGEITVSVRLLGEDNEKAILEFAVKDTGIGIEKSKIKTIFDNFQQATSGTSRLYGGTGLGLAIVKKLVESQEGSIHVTSAKNVGSTFSFILSFLKTDATIEIEPEKLDIDTDSKNISVLVVEDIPLNQLLMKTLLDDFGFERDIASNGKIAIEKMAAKTYDVILMDLQMPEMNGFEATDYIRNTLHLDIPIIALTADVTTVDLEKCKAVGMNDYIAKPVDERILYNKIISIVKKPISQQNTTNINIENKKTTCIDLNYLNQRTKSNPILMMEMISAYLEQTPQLIETIKQSLQDKDWSILHAAIHKIIPSFSIMGMHTDYENIAKKVQEYASSQQQTEGLVSLVDQLETVCNQACKELELEFNVLKNTKNEK